MEDKHTDRAIYKSNVLQFISLFVPKSPVNVLTRLIVYSHASSSVTMDNATY